LTRSLLFEKIWNGHSKAVSTVVGTVFLMLIIFMVSANVLLWTFSQNAQYNEEVMKRNQEEADSRNENVVASDGNYSVSGDEVTVEAELANDGAVAAQIVNLWVLDTATQRYGFNNTIPALSLNLNPGDSKKVSATVTMPGADESHTFNSWFLTARGNTIPLEEDAPTQQSTYPKMILGALVLDFDKFRYFNYTGDPYNQLVNFPDGVIGFDVPQQEYVAFGCYLTNVDPANRTMVIDSHSLFWQPGRPSVPEGAWFIVNVNATGRVQTTYSPIAIEVGETKMLVFASANDLNIGGFKRYAPPNVDTTVYPSFRSSTLQDNES
jgi:FlaG/FlaF family flagellin (archaellin)